MPHRPTQPRRQAAAAHHGLRAAHDAARARRRGLPHRQRQLRAAHPQGRDAGPHGGAEQRVRGLHPERARRCGRSPRVCGPTPRWPTCGSSGADGDAALRRGAAARRTSCPRRRHRRRRRRAEDALEGPARASRGPARRGRDGAGRWRRRRPAALLSDDVMGQSSAPLRGRLGPARPERGADPARAAADSSARPRSSALVVSLLGVLLANLLDPPDLRADRQAGAAPPRRSRAASWTSRSTSAARDEIGVLAPLVPQRWSSGCAPIAARSRNTSAGWSRRSRSAPASSRPPRARRASWPGRPRRRAGPSRSSSPT